MATMLAKARSHVSAVVYALASLKLAVCLIVLLAAVIAAATILEAKHGRHYSQWFVYHSAWFIGLLGLLGVSVFCAAYVRFPWKRHQAGFVVTHAGLLVLLGGSMLTLWSGVEGQIMLIEGDSTDQLTLSQHSQITAWWADRPLDPPYVFTFESGPVDWSPGRQLDIGSVDGMRARVLNYYHRGQPVENWGADEQRVGGPLLRFQLEGVAAATGGRVEPGTRQTAQPVAGSLADQDYGAEIFIGPLAIRLQRAISEAMLADFLRPPRAELGEMGMLTIYHADHVQRAAVDQHVGQAIEIGDSGVNVELVQYLGNAKLDAAGQFQPVGDGPRNPLVELKVNLPGDDQPHRQVAFAKSPLLNFDGVYDRVCPVKFVYQHPEIKPHAAVEFLQDSDGRLHARTVAEGECKPLGEVTTDSRLAVPGGFTLTVVEYLPHARRRVSFTSAQARAEEDQTFTPAAEVEIAVAGVTKPVWLQRNSPEFHVGTVTTLDGPLRVQFGSAKAPLGFSLQLVEFRRETNPGQVGNAAYSSVVRLIDEDLQVDDERLISMNQPLTHKGLTFYQSGFREAGHGKETSIFSAAYDPGRGLKYAGSLMVCLGIATMFYMRAYFFTRHPTPNTGHLPQASA